ncbi:hypothetical protein H3H37_12005 [Duganella sp. LX20W]|uniref:Uncharacterized protein n=1 Tax=Rugamonas brunnea TaxID=2758569 RepID=A0A7W2ESE5_9BURK|nr:hypothetical protein [Rugamonas brunnea]
MRLIGARKGGWLPLLLALGGAWLLLVLPLRVGCAEPEAVVVAQAPAQVQQLVLRTLQQLAPGGEARRRYHLALPFGAPLFPPDADLALSPTPDLARWLQLPADARRHDVLIVPDADYYWDAGGAPFSCQFIVHLQAQGAGRTRLTVLQVQPTERHGKKLDLLGRTGPGFYLDIRPAAPAPKASADLLALLAAALAHPLPAPPALPASAPSQASPASPALPPSPAAH